MACQVKSILKTKHLSEGEIDVLRKKVTTPQKSVEVLIKNDPAAGSDLTSVIEIRVEHTHPVDGGVEGTDE